MSEFNYLNEKEEFEDVMTLDLRKVFFSLWSKKGLRPEKAKRFCFLYHV